MAKLCKRYTILNSYIGGSNVLPQTLHGLNNLWVKHINHEFSSDAEKLWLDWANDGQTEVVLTGLDHSGLEDLYYQLSYISWLPLAKFNESADAMNGCCTVISFVVNDRIVAAGNFARAARLTPYNIKEELASAKIPYVNQDQGENSQEICLTEEEIYIVSKIAFLPTLKF